MKTKLIQTKDYLLLVEDEVEINYGDYWIYLNDNEEFDEVVTKSNLTEESWYSKLPDRFAYKKVIAYHPLTKEAKELDLPLLPNPFEKDTIMYNLLNKDIPSVMSNYGKGDGTMETSIDYNKGHRDSWIKGYKAAQKSNKQFSLEDMKKAIEMAKNSMGVDNCGEICYSNKTNEEIIQSLTTQQLPKELIPEYDYPEHFCYNPEENKVLKTIINSEGKQELVGNYKY